MNIPEKKQKLADAIVAAAEARIARSGLAGLRARELAEEAGCAVGTIYTVFSDLDELVLAVNGRTLAALDGTLAAAVAGDAAAEPETQAVDGLVRLALAYLDFAAANTQRWRAVFEHRLSAGRDIPPAYRERQMHLFAYVEAPLRQLRPGLAAERVSLLARSVVSAVHGVVALGLEEKLQALPPPVLREQVAVIALALARGLLPEGEGPRV